MINSSESSSAEVELVNQLAQIQTRISELTAEKNTLERLIIKIRENKLITKDVTRKSSLRRLLIEASVLKVLEGKKKYNSQQLYEFIKGIIYDLNYNTFRSNLHRMKSKGLIEQSERSGNWKITTQKALNSNVTILPSLKEPFKK